MFCLFVYLSIHSLAFFSLFCSFSVIFRSCPAGMCLFVFSLASFLVLPLRAEPSGRKDKNPNQVNKLA